MGRKRSKERAKLIHLPEDAIKVLDDLAEKDRTTTKPYMEKVLISHAKEKKHQSK